MCVSCQFELGDSEVAGTPLENFLNGGGVLLRSY